MTTSLRPIIFTFIGTAALLVGCSAFDSNSQFTKKVTAPAFVSELYGESTQVISISHPDGAYITWMGLVHSNDYEYFEITKVQVGDTTIVEDGVEIDGETFSATPNATIRDIRVGNTDGGATGFADGNISVGGSDDLKIKIKYSPLKANESARDEDGSLQALPHEAYLLIAYNEPSVGVMRIRLEGYVDGVKEDKCTQDVSTMEVIEYQVAGSAFDLYFCSREVANVGQDNTTKDTSDPGYHGESTNLVSIPLTNNLITFYQVDEETVCLLSEPTPSVPAFTLPIPEGLAPITEMDISLVEGSFAECSLDSENNIFCDSNIAIDALVSLSGFSLSNTGFTAEELKTEDCPDFGAISGSGVFGDDSLTLILAGRTLSDQNTEEYHIVDSLVVAEIKLER